MEDYNVGKITIKEKSSGNVVFEKVQEFGESGPYDMDLAAGDYLLECYDVWDDFYRGGLYITIPEESDTYTQAKPYYMCIVGGCYRVDNTNSDGTYFKQGVDYNIDFSVATIDGTKQEVIVGTWIEKK